MSTLRRIGLLSLGLLSQQATAKTDFAGCTSFTSTVTVNPSPGYGNTYQTVIWYVPDTLEICQGVDCGGGRAPPKSVPGCPLYKGTETVTPSFLSSNPLAPPTKTLPPTTFPPTATGTGAGTGAGPTTTGGPSTTGPGAATTTSSTTSGSTTGATTGGVSTTSQSTAAAMPLASAVDYALNAVLGAVAVMAVA